MLYRRILRNVKIGQIDLRCRPARLLSSAVNVDGGNRLAKHASYEWSYVCGPGSTPLLGLTIGQLLNRAVDAHGDSESIVVVHQNLRRTYSQLREDVDKLAAGYHALNLQRGDRIGIWGPNSYEWVLTQFAAARAGLVLVNINPSYKPLELKYCLNKVEVKAIVAAEGLRSVNYYNLLTEIAPELNSSLPEAFHSPNLPFLKSLITLSDSTYPGMYQFSEVLNMGESRNVKAIHELERRIQIDDPVNIQFTSGTTGNPKGATLSHHNIVNNSYFLGFRLGYHERLHRICAPVPLYHCFGCVAGTLSAMAHFATCVFPSPTFNAREAIKAVQNEKCTSLYGTPTMYVDMVHLPDLAEYNITSLNTGIMSGAPCPQKLVEDVVEKLHMKDFIVMYGMTETSPVTFQCYSSDPLERRYNTVGFPSDHTEVKIVNDLGEIVPVNTPGEICTRGYSTMLGYWNDEDKTKEIISTDRWLHTGDVGVIREDGYGRIVGRKKDMLIRGGENIYPREVEEVLHQHPAVAEAHVVGVPDERLGEEVCAWIRIKDGHSVTEVILKDFCKEKLAYFKIPRYWIYSDIFPKTVTGKIQKFKLIEWSISKLQLTSVTSAS